MLERYYFVLYDGALSLKMSNMALNSFCDKDSSYTYTYHEDYIVAEPLFKHENNDVQ